MPKITSDISLHSSEISADYKYYEPRKAITKSKSLKKLEYASGNGFLHEM